MHYCGDIHIVISKITKLYHAFCELQIKIRRTRVETDYSDSMKTIDCFSSNNPFKNLFKL